MSRGVTLLEVLIAAIVLTVGLVSAINVIAGSTTAARRNADYARALMFARSKMDEVLKEPVLQVGSDQGQGVDTSTDYDWVVTIEQTANPSLVLVVARAENRVSKLAVTISALRRPDLQTAPDGSSTDGSSTSGGTSPPAGGAAAGGTL